MNGYPADAAGAVRRNAAERAADPAVTLDPAGENSGELTRSGAASVVSRAVIDPQGQLRLIIPQQMLLRLLVKEGQLAGGFAPAGQYEFNVLDPSFGKLVYSQFQPRRADEPVDVCRRCRPASLQGAGVLCR